MVMDWLNGSDGLPVLYHDFLQCEQSLFLDGLIVAVPGAFHDDVFDLQ
jgi:uncharacterized protein YigE (DUF2233 family)